MTAKPAYRSPEWYAERRTYIGASDMAAAVGLSPWGDPISLWERKVGLADEPDESFRMKVGVLIEPVIGQLASEALGAKLRKVTGPIRHPDHPFLASNPDFRIVGQRGLVQVKHSTAGDQWGESDVEFGGGEGIPLHYRIQGWGELLTTGLDFVVFAVLDPFKGLGLHLIHREAAGVAGEIEDLRLDLVEYWTEYVEKNVMPPPSAMSGEALARRFPRRVSEGIGRIASAEQEQVLIARAQAVEAKKAAEEEVERLSNEIKTMIGDAAFIEGGGLVYRWGETTRTKVDWKLVAASYRKLLLEPDSGEPQVEEAELDAIEGLYTTIETSRGPFTVAKSK